MLNYLVLGTTNKSEDMLGYFTKGVRTNLRKNLSDKVIYLQISILYLIRN